jgi:CheY-like chemotaxis protein
MPDTPTPQKSVLVVDDDRDLRAGLSLILEAEGYRVAGAADGQQALEALRAGPRPDVILLDMMMPALSGWAFRERQLADPALADVPVVVFSAVGDAVG